MVFKNLTCRLHKSNFENTIAYGTITIDDGFAVNVVVKNGKNGKWVAFPNYKNSKGEFKDNAFPVTKYAREEIVDCVMRELEKI